jgi:hypothetical protein
MTLDLGCSASALGLLGLGGLRAEQQCKCDVSPAVSCFDGRDR